MAICTQCNANKAAFLTSLCNPCMEKNIKDQTEQAQRASEEQANAKAEEQRRISGIILTTTPTLENMRITKTLDVITAECVFGMNIFRDILASFTDVFGGRSESSQEILRDARKTCLSELRKEALSVGANAVVGIDLDYSEFSGGGKSMLFLVASGTAVVVEPINGAT